MPFGVQEYRNYALPALAVLETILTRGKSPGTTAMGQERIFQDADNRNYQRAQEMKQEQQAAREWALREKLGNAQIGEFEHKKTLEQEARQKVLEEKSRTDAQKAELLKRYQAGEFDKDLVGNTMRFAFEQDPVGMFAKINKMLIDERVAKARADATYKPQIVTGDDSFYSVDTRGGSPKVSPLGIKPKQPAPAAGRSGEAAKVSSIASTMIPEARQLQEMMRANPRQTIAEIKLGMGKAARVADQVSDKLGRLRSGGAVNRDEEARFKAQIARYADLATGPQSAIEALDAIIKEAEAVSGKMGGGQGNAGGAPVGGGVSIPRVTNAQEFAALPSGTQFVDPKGVVRRKP